MSTRIRRVGRSSPRSSAASRSTPVRPRASRMPTFATASPTVRPAVSRAQTRISGLTAGIDSAISYTLTRPLVRSGTSSQARVWSGHSVAGCGGVLVNAAGQRLGPAAGYGPILRELRFDGERQDLRPRRVRAGSISAGFRVPKPGQQNGVTVQNCLDPSVGYLIIKAVIAPTGQELALLRRGWPLRLETLLIIRTTRRLVARDGAVHVDGRNSPGVVRNVTRSHPSRRSRSEARKLRRR